MRINADYQVWRCCARDNVRMLNCVLLDTWQDKAAIRLLQMPA